MEYRYQVTQLLKEGKSWREISEIVDLNDEELNAIASGKADYISGEKPLYDPGREILCFYDEEEYYYGTVVRVVDKTGELYPEYRYEIKWKDGLSELLWEQQVSEFVQAYENNRWLL